jgi:hypothetical protein
MASGSVLLGSYFAHEPGGSPSWLFRVRTDRTQSGWAVVKVRGEGQWGAVGRRNRRGRRGRGARRGGMEGQGQDVAGACSAC